MERLHGTLTKWNDDRGFGFITLPQGGPEIFVHISAFPRDGTRPTIGELISFEVSAASDGRRRAIGVGRTQRRAAPRRSGRRSAWTLAALALVAVGIGLAHMPELVARVPVSTPRPSVQIPVVEQASFRCDGRTRCSQMTSCAEANYFQKHCPGAQMDGDHDGIACERQWCN